MLHLSVCVLIILRFDPMQYIQEQDKFFDTMGYGNENLFKYYIIYCDAFNAE
jgi:hypothetical protein